MKIILVLSFSVLFVASPAFSQKLNENWDKPAPSYLEPAFCPPEGNGSDAQLNKAKNRVDIPTFCHAVSFDRVKNLHSADGAAERDRDALSPELRAEIARFEGIPIRLTGFIKFGRNDAHPDPNFVGAEKQGPEACNCGSNKPDEVDFHITLVKKKGDDFKDAVIVEMTPRIRAQHPTWNISRLKEIAKNGYQVRVFGFLMFDGEHQELMYEEGVAKSRVRRGTLWEIHPITEFWVKIDGVWKIL